jgi:hypothetical protein
MFDVPNDEELRGAEYKIWLQLYGEGSECQKTRVEVDTAFKGLFPGRHDESCKPIFEELATDAAEGKPFEFPFHRIDNVHPRAWDMILKHGRDYKPSCTAHRVFAAEKRQPAETYCSLNSYEFIQTVRQDKPQARLAYVEGFVFGPIVYPMLHAWNGIGFSGRCVDWTFYSAARWSRYFGIPFTCEEYEEIMRRANPGRTMITMLFRQDCFERNEDILLEILQRPRKRHPQVTVASIE